MRRWRQSKVERLFEHPLFQLERHRLEAGNDRRQAVVLRTPDWTNVIALADGDRVLLVRQWRYGTGEPSLEIPGGLVDPGETHRAAAERELLEETGYRAASWRQIGEVEPNPAFLTNRCSTWLAEDLERLGPPTGDGEEEIELESVLLEEIPGLITSGAIRHALVVAAFHHLHLFRRR